MGEYDSIPFMPDVKSDITEYALDGTLDGLFVYVAREEAAIRNDPVARTTESPAVGSSAKAGLGSVDRYATIGKQGRSGCETGCIGRQVEC